MSLFGIFSDMVFLLSFLRLRNFWLSNVKTVEQKMAQENTVLHVNRPEEDCIVIKLHPEEMYYGYPRSCCVIFEASRLT